MTNEQQTLLEERYPLIFAAIKAANIGIFTTLVIQVDPTLLGNIARMWQVETKCIEDESHRTYYLTFTYMNVDARLYAMIPKTEKR